MTGGERPTIFKSWNSPAGCKGIMANYKDLAGLRYSRLTVVSFDSLCKWGRAIWRCQCDCGSPCLVSSRYLRSGETRSCGCLRRKNGTQKQGSNETRKRLYVTWVNIKKRCLNKKATGYENYGGRGISISKEWEDSFEKFCLDMGEKPTPKHTIERINNDKGYSKENCKWATRKEQANNRRMSNKAYQIEVSGIKGCPTEICKELGIKIYKAKYIKKKKGVDWRTAIEEVLFLVSN